MTIAKLARPEIQALKPYEAAIQVDDTIRLNANEASWLGSNDSFRRPLNRYPEIRPARLRAALAKRYGCKNENLLVTRGTSEAIDLLIRVFCRAGQDNLLTTAPTFSMYKHYAKVQGAEVRELRTSRDDNFRVDVGSLLNSCDESSRLIFICSPNNPTGTIFPNDSLIELLERRGDRSAIVVDEAYVEFGDESSAIELLDRFENLIILRTLSKALAFAGVRCGAVIGPAPVIDMLDSVQAPYALATPVVEVVENAMETECLEEAGRWLEQVVSERERLCTAVGAFPFVQRIWPSAANFFLMQVSDAAVLEAQCNDDKVLLRYFDGDLADCVRVTVGSVAENDQLLRSLAKVASR